MAITVQIDGVGNVQMDDSFKSLSPAQQQATVDEIANQHAGSQPATPAAAPKDVPLGEAIGHYLSGFKQGFYDLPQSTVELGARALDATGLTKSAYAKTKGVFDDMNAIANPDLNNGGGDKYTQGGRTIGNFAATAPALAIAPVAGEGALTSAANGAIQGILAGALTSDQSDSPIEHTLEGGAGGAAFGGAAHLVGQGVAKAIAPAMPAVDDGLNYIRTLLASSKTAPDAAGLRAAQAAAGNKPLTAAEAIGKPAEVGLGALARREGATADAFGAEMAARQAGTPQRMLSDYASASGIDPSAAQGDLESFVTNQQNKAAPLYKAAYDANQSISSPEIDRILATPAGRAALKSAATNMQNDGVLMGVSDPDLLEQAREAGQEIPWKGGVASGLKLRSLDYVKRAIDGQIGVAQRSGDSAALGPLVGLKTRLVKALDDADVTAAAGPNSLKPQGGLYKQARAAAGDYLSAKEAFDNGGTMILDPKVTPQQFAAHIGDLSASASQAFKGGMANKLFTMAGNLKLGPKVFAAPSVRQKLALALGRDKAAAFLTSMEKEATMAAFAVKRAPGNGSPSAEYLEAMRAQDGKPGAALDAFNFGVNAVQHGPGAALAALAASKTRDVLARISTAGMSLPVRDEAGKLLMGSPGDLADALDLAQKRGGLIGGSAPRLALALALRRNIQHVAPRIGGILAAPTSQALAEPAFQ